MNKLFKVSTIVALVFVISSLEAQIVSPVDFMRMNPYQMKTNPATDLPYSSVMSLLIGNVNLNVQNSTLRYDNLFEFDAQGLPISHAFHNLANGKSKNFMEVDADLELFTLYRRIGNGMLTFDWGVKVRTDLLFSNDLFKLLINGNSDFIGENNPANVNVNLNLNAYREFAVGYQHNINEKLSIGGRAKLLFGIANISTKSANAKLFSTDDSYDIRVEEDVNVLASLPRVITFENGILDANGGFRFGDLYSNIGFGADLAVEYRFDEHFGVMAAVNDLGLIHWKLNNMKLVDQIEGDSLFCDNGSFLFDGLDDEQLQLIVKDEYYRGRVWDTIRQYFPIELQHTGDYSTKLNTNVLLRGYYDIDGMNRFILQAQGVFNGSGFRPAMTLAYNGSFFKMLDVCATYTIMPGSYDNIGLGIAGVFNMFHIYLTTNNLLGCFKPLQTSAINAQVGIVFNLRMPEKTHLEKPTIPEYLE